MRELTIVLPHFCNVGMFAEQQKIWADYPPELRAHLHVIVVDDCSPKGHRLSHKAVTVSGLGSLRIFTLLKKIRWNWLACRNLGARLAETDWLLLTDMDHGLPLPTLERLLTGELQPWTAYRFKRRDAPGRWPYPLNQCSLYKPHNDSWLIERALFFDPNVGGYDERLSGCYGTSGEFKDRLLAEATAQIVLDEWLIRYPREVIPDASTLPSMYTRKDDPKNDDELRRLKEIRSYTKNWKPLHGLIPHELVYSSC